MVSIARLSVVKQSSFGLPGQYGRRVTRVNCIPGNLSCRCCKFDVFRRAQRLVLEGDFIKTFTSVRENYFYEELMVCP